MKTTGVMIRARGIVSIDLLLALVLLSGILIALTGMVRQSRRVCDQLSRDALEFRDEIWYFTRLEAALKSPKSEILSGIDSQIAGENLIEIYTGESSDFEPRFMRFPDRTLVVLERDSLESAVIVGDLFPRREWRG